MASVKTYLGIGIMSGTSLDGLDIAACVFMQKQKEWNFEIIHAETITYTAKWKKQLSMAATLNSENLVGFNNEFGRFIGQQIIKFNKKHNLSPDFIASHGHTVFHQPQKKYTLQIGSGSVIAATTGINTISDFRTMDVALGGQGAPLVPFGDRHLFREYFYCLNLGGFSNISFDLAAERIAFDICPVNIVINQLVAPLGFSFDKNGEIASKGVVNKKLLTKLNGLEYYKQAFPKSLGREWLEKYFLPIINKESIKLEDKLRTVYEHIAMQIVNVMQLSTSKNVLITGGGANNTFLVELIKSKTIHEIIIPEKKLIDFKEALIFAYLGLMRMLNQNNSLASVTGARRDSCGGNIILGKI